MNKRAVMSEVGRLVLPLVILAAGVLAYTAIANFRQPPPTVERKPLIPLVETIAIQPHTGSVDIRADGAVVPFREINLSAEVGGRITFKSPQCRAGHFVTEGTLLLEIDPRTYQLDVNRLQEEVKQAEASLEELEVEIQNTGALVELANEEVALRKRELERQLSLQGRATSEASIDESRRAELSARNNRTTLQNQQRVLEATRARLTSGRDLVQARLAQSELDLEKSKVVAPIDGVIVRESVEQDSFVQPGTALFSIEDTSAVEVRCNLRMEELDWILGQGTTAFTSSAAEADPGIDPPQPHQDYHLPRAPATVSYRLGEREYQWDGVLWRYEGIGLEEATRTVPVRILVSEPRKMRVQGSNGAALGGPRALVRGMFVRVLLHAEVEKPLLRVPERAVQPGNVVWCVRDGRLAVVRLRNITLLDDVVIVPETEEGLRAGDRVISTPLTAAADGMIVQVREPQRNVTKEAP
jgi:multidrug efflux pump subunit AcrA (membrane-fusion protein)